MERKAASPFAEWLWGKVRESELGQNEIARGIGISEASLSKYLKGTDLPRRKSARKIARYFDVAFELVERLIAESEETQEFPPAEKADELTDEEIWERIKDNVVIQGRARFVSPEVWPHLRRIFIEEYRKYVRRGRSA